MLTQAIQSEIEHHPEFGIEVDVTTEENRQARTGGRDSFELWAEKSQRDIPHRSEPGPCTQRGKPGQLEHPEMMNGSRQTSR
jgi:hypothetical protein